MVVSFVWAGVACSPPPIETVNTPVHRGAIDAPGVGPGPTDNAMQSPGPDPTAADPTATNPPPADPTATNPPPADPTATDPTAPPVGQQLPLAEASDPCLDAFIAYDQASMAANAKEQEIKSDNQRLADIRTTILTFQKAISDIRANPGSTQADRAASLQAIQMIQAEIDDSQAEGVALQDQINAEYEEMDALQRKADAAQAAYYACYGV
jgi:hypothetical protein